MPRLRQVIANLLSNAIKVSSLALLFFSEWGADLVDPSQFTKDGSITLRVRQEGQTRNALRVRFEVEDTGVGVKQEAIPQLFKPFQCASFSAFRA